MNRKALYFLISPWFIALLVTIIFVLLVPANLSKYETGLKLNSRINPDAKFLAHDFNHDQQSEKVQIALNFPDKTPHVLFRNHQNKLILQWNFSGDFVDMSAPVFGDYDNNGSDEIYVATYSRDSIRLNAFEPLTGEGLNVKGRALCRAEKYNGFQDWRVTGGELLDLNGDGFGELLVLVYAGFTYQPRAIYAWDIRNDSVWRSPAAGACLISNLTIFEGPATGGPFITGYITSTNNSSDHPELDIPYKDSCSWLMVFDKNLNFVFDPVPFPGHPSDVKPQFFKANNEIFIMLMASIAGISQYPNHLAIYDLNGDLIRKRILTNEHDNLMKLRGAGVGPPYLAIDAIDRSGNIFRVHQDLTFDQKASMDAKFRIVDQNLDFNLDGIPDLITADRPENTLKIYPDGYQNPVVLNLVGDSFSVLDGYITVWYDSIRNREIWVSLPEKMFTYSVEENFMYPFRHLYYLFVYLVILGFIFGIQRLYIIRKRKVDEMRQRLILLELKSIKNRMSPHFIFNVMNTMSNMVLKGEKMQAYECITGFSGLLRETLDNSESLAIPLKMEMSQVEKYIRLQWIRFSRKFDFDIKIRNDVNVDQLIPKSTIMTFVENAIKHGLFHKSTGGQLNIRLYIDEGNTIVEVEDNGIGRKAASEIKSRKPGIGLAIMDEYLEVFNKQNISKLSYTFIDKKDGYGNPTGTLVRINIPSKYNCNLNLNDLRFFSKSVN